MTTTMRWVLLGGGAGVGVVLAAVAGLAWKDHKAAARAETQAVEPETPTVAPPVAESRCAELTKAADEAIEDPQRGREPDIAALQAEKCLDTLARIGRLGKAMDAVIACDRFKCRPSPRNPYSLKALQVELPKEPVEMELIAELDDYYNYRHKGHNETHLSLILTEDGSFTPRIHGYIAKDAPLAKELFEELKNGEKRHVTLTLVYPQRVDENSIVDIAQIVALDWPKTQLEAARLEWRRSK